MKAAEVRSRAVEIQQLEEKYREDFQREFRGGVRLCYNQLKIVFEYKIAREKGDISRTSKALDVLKDFLDVSALVSATMSATAEFAPFIAGASIAVSKIKDYSEGLSREQKLKNYKIFMRIIETAMKYSEQFANDAKIEEFADKILAALEESKFFEHLRETIIMRAKGTWLRHEVAEAREIAGSTLYVSHEPFLFRHYQNIQDVAGIPPKQQKDLETSTNQDVQNVVKYMISHMDNFGINREETDIKVIVDKIISYFSTHALSLEVSHNAAVKIYQALLSSHEKDWHQDEEQQSLMIFQIKYLLRNELKTEILDQIEKNPYYLKLLCRKIASDLAAQKHAELFVEHEDTGRVADAKKAVAEYVPQIKSKTKFEFQANFLSDQKAISQFLGCIYQSTEGQRALVDELIGCIENGQPKRTQFDVILGECIKKSVFLDITHGEKGNSILMTACKKLDIKMVQSILSYESGKASINMKSNTGATALAVAIAMKQPEMVRLLLDNGADVNDKVSSYPMLSYAISVHSDEVFDLILNHPKINIDSPDKDYMSPIHIAAAHNNLYAQQRLISLGADIGKQVQVNSEGLTLYLTPLHLILLASTNLQEIDQALEKASWKEINADIPGASVGILHLNLLQGRVEIFKHLLQHPKIKINQRDNGDNILHKAIINKDPEMVTFILDASMKKSHEASRIDINQKTELSYSPIHLISREMMNHFAAKALSLYPNPSEEIKRDALKYDNFKLLLMRFVRDGADVYAPFPEGAKVFGGLEQEYVDGVLKAKRVIEDLSGGNLLHFAIQLRSIDIFNLLIEREDLQLNAQNSLKQTILHLAVISFSQEIFSKVFEKFEMHKQYLDMQDIGGDTALCIAIKSNKFSCATQLIQAGADITIENNDGFRSLDLLMNMNVENVKLYKEARNASDAERMEYYEKSSQAYESILDLILNSKIFSVDGVNKHGQTYLHVAVARGLYSTIDKLLEMGAKICEDNNSVTPIRIAAENGNIPLLEKLLKQDSSLVNLESKTSVTPLIAALKGGHEEAAKLLIEKYGADYKNKASDGSYPIQYAVAAKLSIDFIKSFFVGVKDGDLSQYLVGDNNKGINLANYTMMYGSLELIEFIRAKLALSGDIAIFESLALNLYFAARGGNDNYFKLVTEDDVAPFLNQEFTLSGLNGGLLSDIVLAGYEQSKANMIAKGKTLEEVREELIGYVNVMRLVYFEDIGFHRYRDTKLLELANENPYLAQMLEEKKQQAVDNLVEISNTPEQVFVATGLEHSNVVLQGVESGIFDH